MIQVIENFATGSLKKDLENALVKDPKWSWQFKFETSSHYAAPEFACIDDPNTEDSPQLIHVITENSKNRELVSPLIYKISDIVGYDLVIQRMKANLLWPNAGQKNPNSYHRPHVDHGRDDAKSLIYYVNDSDGDTIIFENTWNNKDPGELKILQRISPKAGSAVLFNSNLYHCSSSPTSGIRVVLNFIFWPAEITEINQDIPPIPINVTVGKGFHNL